MYVQQKTFLISYLHNRVCQKLFFLSNQFSQVSNGCGYTGCPTKKFTFFKPVFLRPLISHRKSSVVEMNLWISSFKTTNSKFSRIFVYRDIKGIRYHFCFSGYSWPTSDNSEITNYFEMACIWPKMITIQLSFFKNCTIQSEILVFHSWIVLMAKFNYK